MTELTQEILKELIEYDPESGKIYWKERSDRWFPEGKYQNRSAIAWNNKFAGKEAFSANHSAGYKYGTLFNRPRLAHKIIWLFVYGENPKFEIDHDDGNPSNNKLSNLFDRNHQDNLKNQKKHGRNKTGVMGVSFTENGKFRAFINNNKKFLHLGIFDTLEEAKLIRKSAEKEFNFNEKHGR